MRICISKRYIIYLINCIWKCSNTQSQNLSLPREDHTHYKYTLYIGRYQTFWKSSPIFLFSIRVYFSLLFFRSIACIFMSYYVQTKKVCFVVSYPVQYKHQPFSFAIKHLDSLRNIRILFILSYAVSFVAHPAFYT